MNSASASFGDCAKGVHMRRIRSVVTILLTALVAVGLMTPSGAAAADPPPDTSTYYLALGDSLAYGEPTGVGYAEDLYKVRQLAHPGIKLIKLGCPRESTATMIRGANRAQSPDSMNNMAARPTSWTQRSGYSRKRRLAT